MIADVRERLHDVPFVPFRIRTSDGREHPVLTRDHAHISPRGNRIVVFLDERPAVILGPLRINSIIDQQTNGD